MAISFPDPVTSVIKRTERRMPPAPPINFAPKRGAVPGFEIAKAAVKADTVVTVVCPGRKAHEASKANVAAVPTNKWARRVGGAPFPGGGNGRPAFAFKKTLARGAVTAVAVKSEAVCANPKVISRPGWIKTSENRDTKPMP
jgi:hypothetical protein